MKSKLLVALMASTLMAAAPARAQQFQECFSDSTLRIDYIFAGGRESQAIYVDQLSLTPRWYGRRQRLSQLPLEGSGQLTMRDSETGQAIYRHSFSTLFQEWLSTEESKHVAKSFENVFLVPMPLRPVDIEVTLMDYRRKPMATMTHHIDPRDILIRRINKPANPYVTLQQAPDTLHSIHIAYVAEGYTAEQMDSFLLHAREAMEALFSHEPFKSLRHHFNVVALLSPSKESGVSEPGNNLWRETALASHFDTFYSERYLTTLHLKTLHDQLALAPYEHIIILANTPHYGGGGIYNSYNLSYVHGPHFRPVVVHEFGHSFGGLADEYEYGDTDPMYFADTEPWEPNLTTKADFSLKWQDLVQESKASLIEGGGYQQKGVWRGAPDCRMRTNQHPEFCPVCQQALERLIMFYVEP